VSPFEKVEVSPFCAHLCSKKLVFQTHPPRDEDEILDGSGHTWCELTQETAGPDGWACDPGTCRAGRGCFQSYTSGLI
jgi:hypothetical protein